MNAIDKFLTVSIRLKLMKMKGIKSVSETMMIPAIPIGPKLAINSKMSSTYSTGSNRSTLFHAKKIVIAAITTEARRVLISNLLLKNKTKAERPKAVAWPASG